MIYMVPLNESYSGVKSEHPLESVSRSESHRIEEGESRLCAPELTECLFSFPKKLNVLYSLPMKGDPLHV